MLPLLMGPLDDKLRNFRWILKGMNRKWGDEWKWEARSHGEQREEEHWVSSFILQNKKGSQMFVKGWEKEIDREENTRQSWNLIELFMKIESSQKSDSGWDDFPLEVVDSHRHEKIRKDLPVRSRWSSREPFGISKRACFVLDALHKW